jgi:hypothetical protein
MFSHAREISYLKNVPLKNLKNLKRKTPVIEVCVCGLHVHVCTFVCVKLMRKEGILAK